MPDPAAQPKTIPQLIEVKKYPNRRLYDSTRSQHLTHEELYDLVVAGHTVRVTESKTGADITNLVLVQALIERNPEKFSAFPSELVHLMIRASDQMLRGFATNWFAQMMTGMGAMGAPTAMAPGWPMPAHFSSGSPAFPWAMPMPPFQARAENPTSSPNADPRVDPVAGLQQRMEAMMRELAELRRNQGG